jgi:hypothetical protein
MTRALRIRVQPKPHNAVRLSVFVPSATGGWYGAGALHLSESLWRLLLYPLLSAGALRTGVHITLES